MMAPDLSEDAKSDLMDEHINARQISDAEFFYRSSLHWRNHRHDIPPPPNKWLAILARRSKGKAAEIKRLLSDSDPFMVIFETFHEVPALFWGFRIGQVGKMKASLCRPVSFQQF